MKLVVLVLSSFILVASASEARAQPAPVCSPCYLTPPGGTAPPPPLALTAQEARLLERGEINKGRYIVGGILATGYGFGIGHTVQGRWLERGWVFTTGEVGALALIVYGFHDVDRNSWCRASELGTECGDRTRGRALILGGIAAFVGFHIWEVIDAWATPMAQAGRLRNLRTRLGLPPGARLRPVVTATPDASGPMAGFDLRF